MIESIAVIAHRMELADGVANQIRFVAGRKMRQFIPDDLFDAGSFRDWLIIRRPPLPLIFAPAMVVPDHPQNACFARWFGENDVIPAGFKMIMLRREHVPRLRSGVFIVMTEIDFL